MSRNRPRRRVTPRRAPVRPREEIIEEQESLSPEKFVEKFRNLSPNTQVYYTKVLTAVILGIPSGALFTIPLIAENWFIIPLVGLVLDILIVRLALKIDDTQSSWPRVILSGTITLFIAFVVVSSLIWMLLFGNIGQYIPSS